MFIPVLFIVLLWAGDPDSLAQLMAEVYGRKHSEAK